MTTRASYTVACLSGHGIGPEVMAQASRAVAHVSRLHGFRVEETHPPFGAEAFTQSGHALPASTRRATLAMQAILVAAAQEPALAVVESELDLYSRIDRVAFGPRGEVTLLSPLGEARPEETLEHAFGLARSSRARVASVGGNADWRRAFRAAAARADGVFFEEVPVARATQGLAFEPERFDVVVTPEPFAEPLAAVTASGRRPRVVATGRLARSGPGVFAPTHGPAVEIAGQGVANPASMLLAAALMLGEGLGERRAAETLAGALLEASSNGAVTPDLVQTGVAATTRQFADVVLSELPFAWTNAEFYREAVA
jgi:isocitrate/isopropylmalate dehydrogenase